MRRPSSFACCPKKRDEGGAVPQGGGRKTEGPRTDPLNPRLWSPIVFQPHDRTCRHRRTEGLKANLSSVLCPLSSESRKEVIQPQVPLRLPCYDFTPVADPTVAGCLPHRVSAPSSGKANSHGVTGGVYKARERIHRGVLIRDY
jgi:hypothetical protein